jgi:hypothetical protein
VDIYQFYLVFKTSDHLKLAKFLDRELGPRNAGSLDFGQKFEFQ